MPNETVIDEAFFRKYKSMPENTKNSYVRFSIPGDDE